MLASLVTATWLIMPGQTLSGISVATGVSVTELAGVNGIPDPNLIYAGNTITIPGPAATAAAQTTPDSPQTAVQTPATVSPAYVPTGTSGFQACVITRESGGDPSVMNSTGHYGLYQFSASTWAEYGGDPASFGDASVAEQNQVFNNAMATPDGASNWTPYDSCQN